MNAPSTHPSAPASPACHTRVTWQFLLALALLVLVDANSHADDGALDTSWKVQVPIISSVHRVFVAPDGKIFFSPGALISLSSTNNYNTAKLVRLFPDGSLDTNFFIPNWPFGELDSLAFQSDGKILFGSDNINFVGDNNSAVQFGRWNADGSPDTLFTNRTLGPYGVKSVVLQPDGTILIGGFFDHETLLQCGCPNPDYPSRSGVALVNTNGSWDPSFDPGGGATEPNYPYRAYVNAIALQTDGKILIAGDFSLVDGQPRYAIARLNSDGSLDGSFNTDWSVFGLSMSAGVNQMTVQLDGKVLIGGNFSGNSFYGGMLRLNSDGTVDQSFVPAGQAFYIDGPVVDFVQTNGTILIGGGFSHVGGVLRHQLARLNVDGSLDTTFMPDDVDVRVGNVESLALQDIGHLLVAGSFSSLGGVSVPHIARVLIAPSPLVITAQPQSQAAIVGSSMTLSVIATGTKPFGYQWRKDGAAIAGANQRTLTLPQVGFGDAGVYDVLVTNLAESVSSASATNTVLASVQPLTYSMLNGQVGYQDETYNGSGNPSLDLSPLSGGLGQLTDGVLADYSFPLPSYHGQYINTWPASQYPNGQYTAYTWVGSYTIEPDPTVYNAPVYPWVGWYTVDPEITFDFGQQQDFAQVAIAAEAYSGDLVFPLADISFSNDGVNFGGMVTYTTTPAERTDGIHLIRIPITGTGQFARVKLRHTPVDTGSFFLISEVAFGIADLSTQRPAITSEPQSQTIPVGSNVTFSVVASGRAPLSYEWLQGGSPIPGGSMAALTLNNVQATDAGTYQVVVANGTGSAVSMAAVLTLRPPTTGQNLVQDGSFESPLVSGVNTYFLAGGNLAGVWQVESTSTLFDLISNSDPATRSVWHLTPAGAQFAYLADNIGATVLRQDLTSPMYAGTNYALWFLQSGFFSSPSLAEVTVGIAPTGSPGDVFTRTFSVPAASDWAQQMATFNVPADGYYSLRLRSTQGSVANVDDVRITFPGGGNVSLPPTVTTQPQSQAVASGSGVTFTVTATGTGPLGYQWRKDGVNLSDGGNLSGAATSLLVLSTVQSTDAGGYDVVISNAVGSVTSAVAVLTVRSPETGGSFMPAADSVVRRSGHTATLLADGRVLITGGDGPGPVVVASAEIYDPTAASFSVTGSMGTARQLHAAVRLMDGRVLVLGGTSLSSAEIYDPATGTFSPTGNLAPSTPGDGQQATLLASGKVLVTGGYNGGPSPVAQLFDPATGTFTATGSMSVGRYNHQAALLQDGRVLVAGGFGGLSSAEIYDPATALFTVTGSMSVARDSFTATLLADGTVLVTGGLAVSSAERYDPAAGAFTPVGGMISQHYQHAATRMQGGSVLITGYPGGYGNANAELYLATLGSFGMPGQMSSDRFLHTATLLQDGTVLIVGGNANAGNERFVPSFDNPLPAFTAQPASQSAVVGASVTFTASASGLGPFTYQWNRNGLAMAGQTLAYLGLFNVQLADAGDYTVTVSNPAGNVTSALATLTVQPPPEALSLVVTTTADEIANDGTTSLREAINYANTLNGPNTISFNIPITDPNYNPVTGVYTLQPASALPVITQPTIIDGTTQPGFNSTSLLPIIELNGSNAGPAVGLNISAGNSTVRSLIINRFSDVGIFLQAGGSNNIEGNFIGTDAAGNVALGNGLSGVEISGSSANNVIGGTTTATRNVISGNRQGVEIFVGNNNTIEGNYIGINVAGTAPVGNTNEGVFIDLNGSGNMIGGTGAGAGNLIAFNGGIGVRVESGSANSLRANSIYSNLDPGITLGTGANNLQSYPAFARVRQANGLVSIVGALLSLPNVTFAIDFYGNLQADASGYGQGQVYIGSINVTSDGAGNAPFSLILPLPASGLQFLTATATDAAGNTSEFSQATPIVVDIPPSIAPVANLVTTAGQPITVSFTLSDSQLDPGSLAVVGHSSNTAVVPEGNVILGGSGSARTVTLTPALNQTGATTITLIAQDDLLSFSATFTLNVILRVDSLEPNLVTGGGLDFLLTVNGAGFAGGAVVLWNGEPRTTTWVTGGQLTAAISAADIALANQDIKTATITVLNSDGTVSNPQAFTFVSANVGVAESQIAPAGQTTVVNVAPTSAGVSGVAATFANAGDPAPVTLTAAAYTGNPTASPVFDAGGGFEDFRAAGADAGDSAVGYFYYPSTLTGATEQALQLLYFNGSAWVLVQSSGNTDPAKDITDNLDSTVSGGRFSVAFDNTSEPNITELTGTVFTVTVAQPPTISSPPQNLSISAANNATFTVVADGLQPLSYQWQHSGVDLPGATSASLVVNNVQTSDAGSYAVRVTNIVGTVTSPSATLAVSLLTPVITWPPPAGMVYGTALNGTQLNAIANVPGSFVYTPAAGTLLLPGNAQTLSVTFTPADPGRYYRAAASVTINVSKALLTVSANSLTKVYGAALPTLGASYAGFVNGDTAARLTTQPTLATTAKTSSNVGSYPITVTGATAGNYVIAFVNGTLSIAPAALTITAVDKSKIYGKALPALTVTYTGFVNGDTVSKLTTPASLSTTATVASSTGIYPIEPSGATGSNYAITFVNGKLTVTPAALTITAQNKTTVYGNVLPAFTATYSGFVNGDTTSSLDTPAVFSTTATASSTVGAYPITVGGASGRNYSITFVAGSLTINPATLTIAAQNKSKIYGTALPALTASYSGFVNGDTVASLDTPVTLVTTATQTSVVGTYPITASGATAHSYTIKFVNGTVTVTKAALTVTALATSKVYGAALPLLAYTVTGFALGESQANLTTPVAITTIATASSKVGTYPITVNGATASNYTITFQSSTLTVTKAPLMITADNKTKKQGTANPTFTATYSAFVNGDTVASLSTAVSFTTTATTSSPVGTYPITPKGASGANYTVTFVNGMLTITP